MICASQTRNAGMAICSWLHTFLWWIGCWSIRNHQVWMFEMLSQCGLSHQYKVVRISGCGGMRSPGHFQNLKTKTGLASSEVPSLWLAPSLAVDNFFCFLEIFLSEKTIEYWWSLIYCTLARSKSGSPVLGNALQNTGACCTHQCVLSVEEIQLSVVRCYGDELLNSVLMPGCVSSCSL